jgi:hypothetical protein
MSIKNYKILGNKFDKRSFVQNLCSEKYKTLLKGIEISVSLNKNRNDPCSWIKRFISVKKALVSKWIYRVNEISTRISAVSFVEIDKLALKFIWNWRIAKTILKKEQSWRTHTLSDFKLSTKQQ